MLWKQDVLAICLFSLQLFQISFPSPANGQVLDRPYYEEKGDVIWDIPTKEKIVAITFDDGPDPIYTPQILDVLKNNNAHATFFLLGHRVKKYTEIVQREVREGHEIGNHTYTHPSFYNISQSTLLNEIDKTEKLMNFQESYNVKLFRPPGGAVNKGIIDALKKQNYTIILWSWHQDTKDWSNPGVDTIVNQVLSDVRNGDIILLHDSGGNRTQTVKALKVLLPELKERGYKFVTVGQLLQNHPKFQIPLNEFR
ncbi:polysaccharide deacetylase family protein [Domibacillus sp. A3M-37]|uniref:polysaccharide deacetylase family protein n=1 Tax=Domibacillus sp. A3M-37 TaxID=2962037 RepID=UPI0020B893AA|nr:polysaccharide deacetylase family protein [Domibacillus sp. A3M-37]MCP3762729.1 polysaccharide deacetylase family protein [Domibacillus sp. A3M-37]